MTPIQKDLMAASASLIGLVVGGIVMLLSSGDSLTWYIAFMVAIAGIVGLLLYGSDALVKLHKRQRSH